MGHFLMSQSKDWVIIKTLLLFTLTVTVRVKWSGCEDQGSRAMARIRARVMNRIRAMARIRAKAIALVRAMARVRSKAITSVRARTLAMIRAMGKDQRNGYIEDQRNGYIEDHDCG